MYVILQLQHSVGDVSNSTSSTVQSLTELVVFFFMAVMVASRRPKLLSVVKQVTATCIPPYCELVSQLCACETLLSRQRNKVISILLL